MIRGTKSKILFGIRYISLRGAPVGLQGVCRRIVSTSSEENKQKLTRHLDREERLYNSIQLYIIGISKRERHRRSYQMAIDKHATNIRIETNIGIDIMMRSPRYRRYLSASICFNAERHIHRSNQALRYTQ